MLESKFQSSLIKEIKERYKGCLVLKNDSSYLQGVPDWSIFYNDKWAMLECKKDKDASHRPNQDYYVALCDDMSFARYICPENKDSVLNELDIFFMKTN